MALSSGPFNWFQSGQKKWELRKFGRQYTPDHVRVGRPVELRRGYNTPDALWGEVGEVVIADNVADFFDQVHFSEVIPVARSKAEALEMANKILGSTELRVLGFLINRIK